MEKIAEKNDERSILGHFGQNLQTGRSLYRPHCLALHIPLPRLVADSSDLRFNTAKADGWLFFFNHLPEYRVRQAGHEYMVPEPDLPGSMSGWKA